MFANRLSFGLEENALWTELSTRRSAGIPVIDLTESNPTQVGLTFPSEDILHALDQSKNLVYEPSPFGWMGAREAISGYYRQHGRDVAAEHIILTASTSEAYSFLFKLLCEPGDSVLVPKPSYPLFDTLARLDGVVPVAFPISTGVIEPVPDRCRAVLAVNPNNPTGIYVSDEDANRLSSLAHDHDLSVIVDEVFLDFPFDDGRGRSLAGEKEGLVFVLGGLSKLAALPQIKVSWITVSGEPELRDNALARLEHISDTYLSVSAVAQHAVPQLMDAAPESRAAIMKRVRTNLETLRHAVGAHKALSVLPSEGGWYQTLRLPAIASSEEWAQAFLTEGSVYVHPGLFFGFDMEACCVLSLIVPPDVFRNGVTTILRIAADRIEFER